MKADRAPRDMDGDDGVDLSLDYHRTHRRLDHMFVTDSWVYAAVS